MDEQERETPGQEVLLGEQGGERKKPRPKQETQELPHLKSRWRKWNKGGASTRIREMLEKWEENQDRASQGAKGRR